MNGLAADDWIPCPACTRHIRVDELCGCDNTPTGPVCLDRCCATDHPVGTWPQGVGT